MSEQVKQLIAWRDEYLQLEKEVEKHPGKEIFNSSEDFNFNKNEKRLVDEYGAKLQQRSVVQAKIQSRFLFMIDHIEKLEEYTDQQSTVISWYIDETGMYYPGE